MEDSFSFDKALPFEYDLGIGDKSGENTCKYVVLEKIIKHETRTHSSCSRLVLISCKTQILIFYSHSLRILDLDFLTLSRHQGGQGIKLKVGSSTSAAS